MEPLQVEAVRGDITTEPVDAIVNAANASLLGGGGVDGAIHAAAGPDLLTECPELRRTSHPGGLAVGEAVATGAGALPCRWVIHTVGPNRHAGETDPALLASCFRRSLEVAEGLGAGSVAVPAVSAGVYGWDVGTVARIAVETTRAWAAAAGRSVEVKERTRPAAMSGGPGLRTVRFVLFGDDALAAFRRALAPGDVSN